MQEYLGTGGFIDLPDFIKLISRLGFNLGFAAVVILAIYYRLYRNRDFVFTYFIFNVITFSICVLLRKVPMELGFALGLFAVFGILRYRTEEIRMRDLTYMFIVIGLGIINSVANKKVSLAELLLVNTLVVGIAAAIEYHPTLRRHAQKPVLYDNLPLLQPGRERELYRDLSERTGLPVIGVQIQRIDLLRDAAQINVVYDETPVVAESTPTPLRRQEPGVS